MNDFQKNTAMTAPRSADYSALAGLVFAVLFLVCALTTGGVAAGLFVAVMLALPVGLLVGCAIVVVKLLRSIMHRSEP